MIFWHHRRKYTKFKLSRINNDWAGSSSSAKSAKDGRNSVALKRVPAHNLPHEGQEHDAYIKPQRPIFDISQITRNPVLNLIQSFGLAAPSVNLRPTCHPRLHSM